MIKFSDCHEVVHPVVADVWQPPAATSRQATQRLAKARECRRLTVTAQVRAKISSRLGFHLEQEGTPRDYFRNAPILSIVI